ncbi:RagB/SusD family nutrient uptake outer membrane protein [Pontibacter qinzhouensis]|uniref:RagB/SusD family nutrient uptake outer membrane protein n=1 Tax=Pontibacter qinzhouensis TaxID=2603253 RepID=A0A5C8K7T6_9BACT|nr:RagB/SusD family nutrient uptake outer membrane protein [Pontibacter qinzhouensis]TXK48911.1 RagB/SusD family nutrient uptake outer membrane protein [Pontibacter qinzhouensis]
MNYRKSIYIRILALSVLLSPISACKDFLEEELMTQRTTEYFTTEEGIQDLAVGMYYNLRFHFSSEWGFATTNYGTDEFRVGGDASNSMWNDYGGNFNSLIPAVNVNTVMAQTLWDNMYIGINSANLLLQNAEAHLPAGTAKDTYKGEAHFIRAFNYLKLVRQYGGVPLKLTPSTTVEREFERSSTQAVVEQIIADFNDAYNLLPVTASVPGKITKDAAAHFLAKAYLFRASEINDSWNGATKASDLEQGLRFADEVIGRRQLAPNFADLWNYTTVNGPNESLNEILLAAQFTFDQSTRGSYGNQMHLFYLSQYLNLPHMMRDIAGGREYQRLRTNYYAYNVYDRVNDSRFWKSFKTKYAVNNPAAGSIYQLGDLSVMYVINNPSDTRFNTAGSLSNVVDAKTGKVIPSVFPIYAQGADYLNNENFQNRFAPLNKFIDGSREAVGDVIGYRDGILARLADTYLTAAELAVRQGDYGKALTYINTVRERGTYKEGENRTAYTDGGAAYNATSNPAGYASFGARNSFYPENSYYESNNMPVTTAKTSLTITSFAQLPAEDEAIIRTLGYASEYDRALAFILNERSRELMGEFYRWEDLSRTKTLIARARAFNRGAAPNIQDKHNLRPIPQSHLDAIQKNGSALTSTEKQQEQNPGY